jgi:hypothetical protein
MQTKSLSSRSKSLSHDMIHLILDIVCSDIPYGKICKLRTVCKDWNDYLTSEEFITSHGTRIILNKDIIAELFCSYCLDQCHHFSRLCETKCCRMYLEEIYPQFAFYNVSIITRDDKLYFGDKTETTPRSYFTCFMNRVRGNSVHKRIKASFYNYNMEYGKPVNPPDKKDTIELGSDTSSNESEFSYACVNVNIFAQAMGERNYESPWKCFVHHFGLTPLKKFERFNDTPKDIKYTILFLFAKGCSYGQICSFKRVCKEWNAYYSSPEFLRSQYKNISTSNHKQLFEIQMGYIYHILNTPSCTYRSMYIRAKSSTSYQMYVSLTDYLSVDYEESTAKQFFSKVLWYITRNDISDIEIIVGMDTDKLMLENLKLDQKMNLVVAGFEEFVKFCGINDIFTMETSFSTLEQVITEYKWEKDMWERFVEYFIGTPIRDKSVSIVKKVKRVMPPSKRLKKE